MKKHTKLYMEHFGYGLDDFIPCELLGVPSNDVHHINNRGAGGTTEDDTIENLMGIDRALHTIYGDKQKHMDFLIEAHRIFMLKEVPYVTYNPHHPSFDLLEGTAYESRVIHERNIIDELNKYKV